LKRSAYRYKAKVVLHNMRLDALYTASELAERTGLGRYDIIGVLKRLRNRGYVEDQAQIRGPKKWRLILAPSNSR
jgi:DNA-binding MarR family transcriptional regulator